MEAAQFSVIHAAFSSISYTSEKDHLEFENSYHRMYNCVKKIQTYSLDAKNQHSHKKNPKTQTNKKPPLWRKTLLSAFHS